MSKSAYLFVLSIVLSWSALSAAQEKNQPTLTAREIFYKPKAAATATTKPAPASTANSQKAANPAPQKSAPPPVASTAQDKGKETPAPANASKTQTVAYSPLGLRYSLLRRSETGQYIEVHPDTIFRSGDGLRLSVESNDTAYLYIVARGSSGTWNVLFPSAAINKGDNRIDPHSRHEIPAGGQFTFDQQPGTERVFVVLSRTEESDLEGLIYSMSRSSSPARPAASVKTIAQNIPTIPDPLVGRLRQQLVSRDLVFEKVDDVTSSRKEKAAYVVNSTGAMDGRVVVDLNLQHQ